MTESEFENMCKAHDLTYSFSDDQRVWRNGVNSYRKIRNAAKQLDTEVANKIWNRVVDQKINAEHVSQFYW